MSKYIKIKFLWKPHYNVSVILTQCKQTYKRRRWEKRFGILKPMPVFQNRLLKNSQSLFIRKLSNEHNEQVLLSVVRLIRITVNIFNLVYSLVKRNRPIFDIYLMTWILEIANRWLYVLCCEQKKLYLL